MCGVLHYRLSPTSSLHFLLQSSCPASDNPNLGLAGGYTGRQGVGTWGGYLSLIRQVGVWDLQGEAEEAVLLLTCVAPPPSLTSCSFPLPFPFVVPSLPITALFLSPQQLLSPHPPESPVDRLLMTVVLRGGWMETGEPPSQGPWRTGEA